jgi:hypothetical protein
MVRTIPRPELEQPAPLTPTDHTEQPLLGPRMRVVAWVLLGVAAAALLAFGVAVVVSGSGEEAATDVPAEATLEQPVAHDATIAQLLREREAEGLAPVAHDAEIDLLLRERETG